MAQKRIPVLDTFGWQEPIENVVASPSVTAKGTRYLVGTGTGDFEGHDGAIAWHDGSEWVFDTPRDGMRCYNKSEQNYYTYRSNEWVSSDTLNGFTLTGDIESTTENITWVVAGDTTSAFVINSSTTENIFVVNTTEGEEGVSMNGDLVVHGNLTVEGDTTIIETQTLTVEDKLITVNKGGIAESGNNSGLEVEEDGLITGYCKVDESNRSIWVIKAPGGNTLDIDVDVDSTLDMNGDLHVESASYINQDVTTDATPQFNGVNIGSGTLTNGTDSMTVAEIQSAINAAASYDEDLGVLLFDV